MYICSQWTSYWWIQQRKIFQDYVCLLCQTEVPYTCEATFVRSWSLACTVSMTVCVLWICWLTIIRLIFWHPSNTAHVQPFMHTHKNASWTLEIVQLVVFFVIFEHTFWMMWSFMSFLRYWVFEILSMDLLTLKNVKTPLSGEVFYVPDMTCKIEYDLETNCVTRESADAAPGNFKKYRDSKNMQKWTNRFHPTQHHFSSRDPTCKQKITFFDDLRKGSSVHLASWPARKKQVCSIISRRAPSCTSTWTKTKRVFRSQTKNLTTFIHPYYWRSRFHRSTPQLLLENWSWSKLHSWNSSSNSRMSLNSATSRTQSFFFLMTTLCMVSLLAVATDGSSPIAGNLCVVWLWLRLVCARSSFGWEDRK